MMWQSILTDRGSSIFDGLHIVVAIAWIGSSSISFTGFSLKPGGDLLTAFRRRLVGPWRRLHRIIKHLVAPKRRCPTN